MKKKQKKERKKKRKQKRKEGGKKREKGDGKNERNKQIPKRKSRLFAGGACLLIIWLGAVLVGWCCFRQHPSDVDYRDFDAAPP